jgi:osmotically-inducible protein OsmY
MSDDDQSARLERDELDEGHEPLTTMGMRAGETADAPVAAEEGLAWVQADALAGEDELSARVREALRADAATSRYAESLAIDSRDQTVAVRGVVDDVDDSDNVVEVASRVIGVDEVVDELDVRALEGEQST